MKKIVSHVMLAALVATATSCQADLSKTSALLGGLGLYFATKGITIAQVGNMSFQEVAEGRFIRPNFKTTMTQKDTIESFISDNFQNVDRAFSRKINGDEAAQHARKNILLSIASFALLWVFH